MRDAAGPRRQVLLPGLVFAVIFAAAGAVLTPSPLDWAAGTLIGFAVSQLNYNLLEPYVRLLSSRRTAPAAASLYLLRMLLYGGGAVFCIHYAFYTGLGYAAGVLTLVPACLAVSLLRKRK